MATLTTLTPAPFVGRSRLSRSSDGVIAGYVRTLAAAWTSEQGIAAEALTLEDPSCMRTDAAEPPLKSGEIRVARNPVKHSARSRQAEAGRRLNIRPRVLCAVGR